MIFACDFETETAEISEFQRLKIPVSPNLLAKYDKSDKVVNPIMHGAYSHDGFIKTHTFMEFLKIIKQAKIKSSQKNPITILYHNLTYDFAIIMEELLYEGFIQVVEDDDTKQYKGLPTKHIRKKYTKSNTFTIVGADLRQMRFSKLHYKGIWIEFIDTWQIFTGSLDAFTNSFNVEYKKLFYDWNTHVVGTNRKIIEKYLYYDCRGLLQAYLAIIAKLGIEGKTMSGITMTNFKKEYLNQDFKKVFPVLSDKLRKISHYTYHGGIVYVNEKYKNTVKTNIVAVDVNSMYPYVMQDFKFPYGLPKILYAENQINIQKYQEMIVYIDYEMVKMFPFFRVYSANYYNELYEIPNQNYKRTSTPKNFSGYIAINSIDLKLLKKYAKINELIYMEIYEYDTRIFFDEFMKDKMQMKIDMKKRGDFGGVYTAKVQGNGLYGKFGQDLTSKPYNKIYINGIDDDTKKNYIKYHQVDLEGVFTPVASAVTSYSRQILLEGAEKVGFDKVVYADTDSLYFIDNDGSIIDDFSQYLHYTEIGKWDVDRDSIGNIIYYNIKVLGLKTYYVESKQKYWKIATEGKYKGCHVRDIYKSVKCVGLNSRVAKNFTLETFANGAEMKTKKSQLGKGGVHIYDTVYKLRRWDL